MLVALSRKKDNSYNLQLCWRIIINAKYAKVQYKSIHSHILRFLDCEHQSHLTHPAQLHKHIHKKRVSKN